MKVIFEVNEEKPCWSDIMICVDKGKSNEKIFLEFILLYSRFIRLREKFKGKFLEILPDERLKNNFEEIVTETLKSTLGNDRYKKEFER